MRLETAHLLQQLDHLENKRVIILGLLNADRASTKKFPVEMLVHIFSFLCPLGSGSIRCRHSRSLAGKEHPTADLRRVSQVCSVWRTAAVASSSLWSTNLNFKEALPWLKELVRRCGSMPIHITANFSSFCVFEAQGMIDKFEMIRTTSPNIGSISVGYARASPFITIIENFIPRMCTSATRLSFSMLAPQSRGYRTHGELLPSLGHPRHLRELEVNGYHPDLTLPCFHQLACLSVSSLSGVTANDWVRVLAGLPELEHLRLEDSISSNIFQVGSSAKFPSLKTLAIIGEFDDGIGDFFLAIEATKKYSLFLHCSIGKNTNLDQLLHILRKWFALWSINLHMEDVCHRRVDFIASHTRFRVHNQIPGREHSDEWFRLFLNWRRLPNPFSQRKLQSDIFKTLGPVLRKTQTLSICPDRYDRGYICGPNFWLDYFHNIRTLRFLNSALDGDIAYSNTGCFINALCNDVERSTTSDCSLPLLRVLSFEYENFTYNPGIDCTQTLERLTRVLGHRIDVVELYACNGSSNVCSLLKYWGTRIYISDDKSPRF